MAHFAVIVFYIFKQPFNRIVSVRAFINIFFGFALHLWRHIGEGAFAHVPAAHILIDENIFVIHQELVGAQRCTVFVFAIWRDAVAGTLHDERVFLRLRNAFWNINGSEEFYTIAHRDVHFLFRVIIFYKCIVGTRLRECGEYAEDQRKLQEFFHE